MEIFLSILGTAITILSIIFGYVQTRRYKKLEDYNREQSWEIYRQASNVLGLYQQIDELNINNPSLIKLNAQGKRAAIELVVNSVRMIKRFEKRFNEEQIQRWSEQGKLINDTHVKTFWNFI